MFQYNIKLAIRNILKQKYSYLLNVAGLIIALTVCCITLFYVLFEKRYVKYDFNIDNLYKVRTIDKDLGWYDENLPLGLSEYLAKNVPCINSLIKYKDVNDFNIMVKPGMVFKETAFHFVDSNYMRYKNKRVISGTCELINPDDILLTKQIALKYYGTTNCIGKKLTVYGRENNNIQFVVSGVFDYPAPNSSRPDYNLVARLDFLNKLDKSFGPDNLKCSTEAYLLLDKEVDTALIMKQIIHYYQKNEKKDFFSNRKIKLITPSQIHAEHIDKKVNTVLVISFIILIVALINFIIHNNAQSLERSKTLGIKKIVGSKKRNIFFQSFLESFIINSISFLIGFFIAVVLLPPLKKYLDDALDIEYIPLVQVFLMGMAVIIILSIFTSLSIIVLASQKPVMLVKKQFSKGNTSKLINSTLIITQTGVFTFLMIMFFITSRQLRFIHNIDWGFNAEQLIHIPLLEDDRQNRYLNFIEKLHQIPAVISSTGCTHTPSSYSGWIYGFVDNGKFTQIEYNNVDYSFLKTLGMKIKAGRDFNDSEDKYSHGKIIVNQSFLDLKEIKDPFDPKLKPADLVGENKQIIGVVDDFHSRGMDVKILPMVIQLKKQDNFRNALIRISPVNVSQTIKLIEAAFKSVYPEIAYNMYFIDDEIQNLYNDKKKFNSLISYYSVISTLIACMGLFGFVLYEMTRRTKEVGIRKVHGAKVQEIVSFLNREFIILVLIASLIAVPLGYYYSNKWMENFAYKTTIPFWIFLAVEIMVLAITFLTISFQTFKIARRNPVDALRYE